MNNEQASQELSVLAGALVAPEGACLEAGEEEPWLDAMMRGGICQ